MKKSKLFLSMKVLLTLLALFALAGAQAQPVASSEVILANDEIISPNVIEFDLYVKSTNNVDFPDGFPYGGGQYRINFNPAIRNGANTQIFFEMIPGTTGLTNTAQAPPSVTNPSLAQSFVRLTGPLPVAYGAASIISPTGNGTRIIRLRMTSRDNTNQTPVPFTPGIAPSLVLSTSAPGATTTSYVIPAGTVLFCSPQVLTTLLNNLPPNPAGSPPLAFNVTGGGSYCQGLAGLPVGLEDSELEVNYELLLGGAPMVPPVIVGGTGEAITFGDQLAGVYTVTGTNAFGSTPMTGEAVITEMPLVTSTVAIAADPAGPVCQGTTVTFTATPVNGGDQPAYEWFVGGVSQGIDFSGSFSYVPVDGDAVYVVMIPDILCSAGNATSNTIDMVVEEPLPVSVSIEADDTEVCAGTSVTFTATPMNGGTPDYQWYLNGNTVGNNSAIYSVIPENGDQVYVVMNSSLGCTTGNPATSNTIAITVNPLLTPSVSIVADPAGAVTTGTTVTFTATPVYGGVPTYEWFVNGSSVATGNPYAYIPLNGDEVYVIMTSTEACVTTATAVSDIITMVVEDVILPPVAFEMTGGGSYCEGEDGVVVGLSGSEIGVTYTLYQDAVAVASTPGTGAALDFGLRLEGVYTASGTNSGGTTDMTGSAIVIENALPDVTCPTDMDVCINAGGQTLAGGSPTGGVYSGTGVTDGIFYPAVAGVGAHTITYTYEDMETGCSDFCTFTITVLDIPAAAGLIAGPATVTEGDMGVAYNVGVIANATSYVWVYSGTGVTIFGTGNMITLDFAIGASSGVLSVYGVNSCGMGVESFFDITVEPQVISCTETTWTGLIDEGWFNIGNWDPCVPTAETDVTIPGGVPNFPTLTVPAECASILILDGGSFIGAENLTVAEAEVQRYFANSDFHFLSSPVTNINFGTVFPLNQDAVWAREYDEPSGDWVNLFVYDFMEVGLGYSIEMTEPQMALFPGVFNSADVTKTLSYQNMGGDPDRVGWNLLGNPFQSAISWNAMVGIMPTAVAEAAVYVWDGVQYVSWNGYTGALTDGIIPAQNGFFVKAMADQEIFNIPLTARVHSNIPFYKSNLANLLKLSANGNNFSDAAFIRFNEAATPLFDGQHDAYKLWGLSNAPQLYSIVPGDVLSINELPFEGNEVVNLGFKCGIGGTYSITASGMESFSANTPVMLEDLKLNTIQDLRQNPVYNFTYNTSDNENRFRVHFKAATGINDPSLGGISVYSYNHTVVITNTTGLAGDVRIYDLAGRELINTNMGSQMTTRIPMQAVIGTYIVKVITEKGTVNHKVFIR
ncbi:protein containing Por secretion system C-terminal sorting domain [Lentimicrobium saccharophilum]|uniref:Protein containing Por secretion system C-terminal sorting domain n=1 Tax=Lentimicrobium saccharophilum TaxID=1678841 RepID=A0A0S7C0X6_9BACT|nr:T9SS type A sorting domain-containing protein [Lentimicrobium saccharophilum]GAP42745.1 protein containing Por secretion system C-terminal sorting domain [Lentimicrobium saccharophilum]